MEYLFKVNGDPIHFYNQREQRARTWGGFKEQQVRWVIALESKLEGKRIKAPIDVDIHLYCKKPSHIGKLSSYAKFMEGLFAENFLSSVDIIYSLNVYKHLAKADPYTILTIKERL